MKEFYNLVLFAEITKYDTTYELPKTVGGITLNQNVTHTHSTSQECCLSDNQFVLEVTIFIYVLKNSSITLKHFEYIFESCHLYDT